MPIPMPIRLDDALEAVRGNLGKAGGDNHGQLLKVVHARYDYGYIREQPQQHNIIIGQHDILGRLQLHRPDLR